MKCGLLGRRLGHSYSPAIHSLLGDYEYKLFEIEPDELQDFLRNGDWDGINVTIPYKQAVIPYLDACTPIAQKLGAVNTIVRRNGKLIGHNTDHAGFAAMVHHSGLSLRNKKCLILGSGGASKVVRSVLEELGATAVTISRSGVDHYGNLFQHHDASIIVNATPVGMYPDTGISPVDIGQFPRLEGVMDLIYNPARTQLLLDCEARGIPAVNGLYMLVAQAKYAAEWFQDHSISDDRIDLIYEALKRQTENIILVGMPGSGKSTLGQMLALNTGRMFVDSDAEIAKLAGKSIPQIFSEDGEAAFRQWETKVLAEFGKRSSLVIATGGGCVTQMRNYPLLHQNGRIFWICRSLDLLPTAGRPLSQQRDLSEIFVERATMYQSFSDHVIQNNGSLADAISQFKVVL